MTKMTGMTRVIVIPRMIGMTRMIRVTGLNK